MLGVEVGAVLEAKCMHRRSSGTLAEKKRGEAV